MCRLSVVLFIVVALTGCTFAENVPVLMWGPQSKASPALANGLEQLGELIKKSPLTLAFVEEILAPEDFSHCKAACFPYLSTVESKSYIQVAHPLDKVEEDEDRVEYVNVDKDGKLDAKIPTKDGSVVVISFVNDPSLSREENLAKHDAYIKNIYNDITSNINSEKLLVLYTGKSSGSLTRHVREATEAPPAATATSYTSPQLLLYFTSLTFLNGGKETPITVSGLQITNASANSFDVSLPTGGDPIKFTIANGEYGYWNLINLEYGEHGNFTSSYSVGAADGFSYFCGPATNYTTKGGQMLSWVNLQLEPTFTNTTNAKDMTSFNDPYNCVGFTSIPIWSGIMVSFVLLFILSIGITWLMDINTMDRFDDPKGKTITVNTLE